MHAPARLDSLGTEQAYVVLAAARALEAAGHRVVHLEIGEPDMPTPPHVVEAGGGAPKEGPTPHPRPPGGPPPPAPLPRSPPPPPARAPAHHPAYTPLAPP